MKITNSQQANAVGTQTKMTISSDTDDKTFKILSPTTFFQVILNIPVLGLQRHLQRLKSLT